MSKGDGLILTIGGVTGYFPKEFIEEAIERYVPIYAAIPANFTPTSKIEKLENKLSLEAFESILFSLVYLGGDGKWHTKRNNAEKTTEIIERFLELADNERR